jgi:hypothetical protein
VSKEANYQKANLQNNPRWGRIRFSQGSLICLSNKRHQAANKWLGSWPFCSILYDYKVLEHRPGKHCPNISGGLTKWHSFLRNFGRGIGLDNKNPCCAFLVDEEILNTVE